MTIDPIDRHVGARMRALRKQLRLSQTQLGDALGVTFRQVQNYENGTNQISASMLVRTARCLDVSHGFFFEGFGDIPSGAGPKNPFLAMAADRAGLDLAEIWPDLTSEAKQALLQLAEALKRQPRQSS